MLNHDDLYSQNSRLDAAIQDVRIRLNHLQTDVDDIRLRMRITAQNEAPRLARLSQQLTDIARGLIDLANRP